MNEPMGLKLPRCPECGGRVELRAAAGRKREVRRGVFLEIPEDFGIPTCVACGEESMVPEVSEPLDRLLSEMYVARQAETARSCIGTIQERHGVTQQQVEAACGVTASYLSHVTSGKREASRTLMRLIEVFALFPEAFDYALRGQPFDKHMVSLFAIPARRTYRPSAGFKRAMGAQDYSTSERFLEETG